MQRLNAHPFAVLVSRISFAVAWKGKEPNEENPFQLFGTNENFWDDLLTKSQME